MRVLMVLSLPKDRTLGAARIQVELAGALRENGCDVDFLCGPDIYPSPPRLPRGELLRSFARASRSELRRLARNYDVIDGLEGDVTASKEQLAFSGVLVARSPGLRDFYVLWERQARAKWPQHPRANPLGRVPRALHRHHLVKEGELSRVNADGFFAANAAERDYLVGKLGDQRVCHLPFGLLDEHRLALNDVARQRPADASPHVTFVGTWDARKGKYDCPAIIRRVIAEVPDARFSFMGTRASRDRVAAELGVAPASRLAVYPSFEPAALPSLLAPGTAAAFPSYLEGFGFAVIEQLAAGLPVVAYDVPGPRDILSPLSRDLLVTPGDTAQFATRLVSAMRGAIASSEDCVARASQFRWPDIARRTIQAYTQWAELAALAD